MDASMAENSSLLPHEQPASPRTDLWIAVVFFVFATAAAWLAFRMPTYTEQKGEIYTAPGLVPGFYGVVMVVLSVWLGYRAIRQGALLTRRAIPPGPTSGELIDIRLALAAAICLLFVIGLIGRVPFWVASATFVAAFAGLFEWQWGQPWPQRARRIGEAVALGVATGVAVTLVFEKVFYVRLP
jgi:Tripartite tricarboxylate transporter TctB family